MTGTRPVCVRVDSHARAAQCTLYTAAEQRCQKTESVYTMCPHTESFLLCPRRATVLAGMMMR